MLILMRNRDLRYIYDNTEDGKRYRHETKGIVRGGWVSIKGTSKFSEIKGYFDAAFNGDIPPDNKQKISNK